MGPIELLVGALITLIVAYNVERVLTRMTHLDINQQLRLQ